MKAAVTEGYFSCSIKLYQVVVVLQLVPLTGHLLYSKFEIK